MKKVLLLLTVSLLLPIASVFSQDHGGNEYVLQQRGDTLVVKDDIDYGAPNTLYSIMNADSLAPAGRVYLLHNKGIYSLINNPTSSAKQKTIIMGETQTSLKVNKGDAPPVLQGAVWQGGSTTGGINSGYDLLVKNCDVEIGNSAGYEGWSFFGLSGPGLRIQVDNCIIEHNLWTVIGGPPANSRIFFTNDYFVNFDGHTCRRTGGVLDFFKDQDTIFVENCTHVNVQGSEYKARPTYKINRYLFNHNDFIDCSGYIFMNNGDHPNFSVTNNIFVNVQVQGFAPVLSNVDVNETDPGNLPMGLVNLLDDSAFTANGASFYADNNLAYWDPSLSDVTSTLNAAKVDGATNWSSQMITMNSRTQAMFNNKTKYPKLTNGTWFLNELPNFKNTDVLFTTQLAILKAWSLKCVDTNNTETLTSWRQASNPESQHYTNADWPIPIDLSYSNSDLLTAGINNFPVGDLDWFPSQYASWKAQESAELANINNVLTTGVTAVEKTPGVPQQFQLQQNYPNPFNPTTKIEYQLPAAGHVTLRVYDVLGREMVTLASGIQDAGVHVATFDGTRLASGVYFYRLTASGKDQVKKMLLTK
jgi:hypothetical protein